MVRNVEKLLTFSGGLCNFSWICSRVEQVHRKVFTIEFTSCMRTASKRYAETVWDGRRIVEKV
jgi:hypothetical protein